MKKKFIVRASYIVYLQAEIEAENEDKAFEIAQDLDGGMFEPEGGTCGENWRIDDVYEVQE